MCETLKTAFTSELKESRSLHQPGPVFQGIRQQRRQATEPEQSDIQLFHLISAEVADSGHMTFLASTGQAGVHSPRYKIKLELVTSW